MSIFLSIFLIDSPFSCSSQSSLFQSLCLLGYCIFPFAVTAIIGLIFYAFTSIKVVRIIKFLIGMVALAWSLYGLLNLLFRFFIHLFYSLQLLFLSSGVLCSQSAWFLPSIRLLSSLAQLRGSLFLRKHFVTIVLSFFFHFILPSHFYPDVMDSFL